MRFTFTRAAAWTAALLVLLPALAAPPGAADAPRGLWAVGLDPGAAAPIGLDAAAVAVDARHAGFLIVRDLDARAVEALRRAPGVRYVAADAEANPAGSLPPLPDPLEGEQWGLAAVNASGAWALVPGRQDVTVAVVDSGADLAHADLALNYWGGNPMHGANVAEPFGVFRSLPAGGQVATTDENGHGTLVAGVVAATPANGVGVRGVADVPIMVVKMDGLGAPGTATALAAGIVWAVDHGARVASVSQVLALPHPAVTDAVAYAESRGVVVVAAAGNDGRASVSYPSGHGTVVSVGATDRTDAPWPSSSHGKVDLAGPGVDVLTTRLGNLYAEASGTSFATPHVSAVAALVLAADPTLSPAEVRALLNATARDVHEPGRDARTGHGIVDAGAAVAAALAAR